MGLLGKLLGKKKEPEEKQRGPILEDVIQASEWVVWSLQSSGYQADYTLEGMKEIDRFFDEQSGPDGILKKYYTGQILFALASYIGQTVIRLYGGKWILDSSDPKEELNIMVEMDNGTRIFPVWRCIKRYQEGPEEGIYVYVYALDPNRERGDGLSKLRIKTDDSQA